MDFKGHKNSNGNYITKAEQIKSFKKFKKEQEKAQKEYSEQLERDEKIALAQIMERRKESERLQQELENLINKKVSIQNKLAKELQYKEFIIMYDLFNGIYYEIKHDISKGKITINNVLNVIDKINSIFNIINKDNVIEYLKAA